MKKIERLFATGFMVPASFLAAAVLIKGGTTSFSEPVMMILVGMGLIGLAGSVRKGLIKN